MNITPENYKESFQQALHVADPTNGWISELPEALQKGHEFVLEATDSLTDWTLYKEDADIERTIDLYLLKLSEYINSKAVVPGETDSKLVEKVRISQKKEIEKDNFNLLVEFMPGFKAYLPAVPRAIVHSHKHHPISARFTKIHTGSTYPLTMLESDDEGKYIVEYDLEVDLKNEQARVLNGKMSKNYSEPYAIDDYGFYEWLSRFEFNENTIPLPDINQKTSTKKVSRAKNANKINAQIFKLLQEAISEFPSALKKIKHQDRFNVSFGDRTVDVFLDKNHFKENSYGITLHEGDDEQFSIRYVVEIDTENEVGHVLNEHGSAEYKKLQNANFTLERDTAEKLDKRFVEWMKRAIRHDFKVNPYGDPVQFIETRVAKAGQSNWKGKYVELITEEVKFIKRFVGLHNKIKTRSSILAFVKALQRSILQKLIRKTSPLAGEIQTIQEKLVDAYNKAKKEELEIAINPNDLSRLVTVAGGEEVYHSIKIIKRYVGLQGREVEHTTLESFLKQIQNAVKSEKVSQEDPYYKEVKGIQSSVKKLIAGEKVKIGKVELNGLEGILNGCGCTDNPTRKTRQNKGLGSITPGVLSAEQMANLKVEELNFTYPWDVLLGKPATNFSVMFHGDPGSGKTTLLLKFVEYLALNFGKVLYVSSEEHGATTLIKKINALLPVQPSGLDFAANLSDPDLSQYDFIVLDSVNNLKLKLDDFKQLKKDYPQTSFIVVLQHTKDGNYRGGKDWEHDIEMAVKVEHGIATVYRTRYGVYGTLDFFSHFRITPDMFK